MKLKSYSVVLFFRGLWIILALGLLFFIIAKNIYTARTLSYSLDFRDSNTRDWQGWYPVSRTSYDNKEQRLKIIGEPVYLKIYLPVKFDTMSLAGSWSVASTTVRLGVKQTDNSWFYKDIDQKDWSANFDLSQAKIYRNQIELMISIPDYNSEQNIYLDNNWQVEFKR